MITLIEKYLTAQLYAGQAAVLSQEDFFANAHHQYGEALAYCVRETRGTGEMVDMQAILKTVAREACSYASESFIQPSIPATVLSDMERDRTGGAVRSGQPGRQAPHPCFSQREQRARRRVP
jgi:hypothetical protein